MSSAPLRRVSSRALRAASRACAASTTLPTTVLGVRRMLLEPLPELFVDEALDHRPHFGRDQLVLRLRREFRVGAFDRKHAGQALAAIVAGQVDLLLFGEARALGVVRHLPRQRRAEADEMRAAVALRDVVGEGQHVLVVAVVPPQRDLDADAAALPGDQDRLDDQRRLGAVEIAHEGLEAALIIELLGLHLGMARVGEQNAHAGIQERQLAQAMLDRREIELDVGERLLRSA